MIKLYFIIAIVYSIVKALRTLEVEPVKVGMEFGKNFFLFPFCFISDSIDWIKKTWNDEPEIEEIKVRDRNNGNDRKDRNRDRTNN